MIANNPIKTQGDTSNAYMKMFNGAPHDMSKARDDERTSSGLALIQDHMGSGADLLQASLEATPIPRMAPSVPACMQ